MPLQSGSSRAAVSGNISELVHAGHPQKQAIAIAMKKAGLSHKDAKAAGVLAQAPDGTALFVKRSDKASDHPGEWAFPGGHLEGDEDPQQAAVREMAEETGHMVDPQTLKPLAVNGSGFQTYHWPVTEKFVPTLNEEHTAFAWAPLSDPPHPLHPSVFEMMFFNLPGTVSPEYEPETQPVGNTQDAGYFTPTEAGKTRRMTPEGFLICEDVAIARTGEQVYAAHELPGLTPDEQGKIHVKRSPEEVFSEKTIASFEGKPVTLFHPDQFVTPENHKQHSVGHVQNVRRGAGAESNLLKGDIVITDAAAIHYAQNNLPDISCGYDASYRQLGPGQAEQYQIIGNHAALVPTGRAGERCAIKDSPSEHPGVSLVARGLSSIITTTRTVNMKTRDRGFWLALRGALSALNIKTADADQVERELQGISTADAKSDGEEGDKEEREMEKKNFQDAIDRMVRDSFKRVRDEYEEEEKKKAKDAKELEETKAAEKNKIGEEETGDTLIEAEGPGMTMSLGKTYVAGATDAMTEIRAKANDMAPGMQMPTADACKGNKGAVLSAFLRAAIKTVQTKDKDLVEPFLFGRTVDELRGTALLGAFNGVHALVKIRNNAATRALAGGLRTVDDGKGNAQRVTSSADYAANLAKIRKEKSAA